MNLRLIPLTLIILITSSFAQNPGQNLEEVKPTEIEQQKLSKLKLKILLAKSELVSIDARIYALNRDRILKQQEVNKTINDLSNEAYKIKEEHEKEWGDKNKVNYDPDFPETDWGQFTKALVKKDEIKKEEVKTDGKENVEKKQEGREKILDKKPKK